MPKIHGNDVMGPYRYQLVLQLPGDSTQDLEDLVVLEESLMESFRGKPHKVDGHDFGSGTMNVFIHTNDPVAAFVIAKQAIYPLELSKLRAAYRSLLEDEYMPIWPEGTEEDFRLL